MFCSARFDDRSKNCCKFFFFFFKVIFIFLFVRERSKNNVQRIIFIICNLTLNNCCWLKIWRTIISRKFLEKSIIEISLTKWFFFFFWNSYSLFFFLFVSNKSSGKVREEFKNVSAEVERQIQSPRISNTLSCLLANVRAKRSFPSRSPRIAARTSRFYRYSTVYALIESSPVHFAFYSDSLGRRASTVRLWSWPCESRFTFIVYNLFSQKEKKDEKREVTLNLFSRGAIKLHVVGWAKFNSRSCEWNYFDNNCNWLYEKWTNVSFEHLKTDLVRNF